jgi:hypothetical protein
MSLPAGQERVLHGIEGALKASEPRLASTVVGNSSCTTTVPAARLTTVSGDDQAFPPLARAGTTTARPPGMC